MPSRSCQLMLDSFSFGKITEPSARNLEPNSFQRMIGLWWLWHNATGTDTSEAIRSDRYKTGWKRSHTVEWDIFRAQYVDRVEDSRSRSPCRIPLLQNSNDPSSRKHFHR